MLKKFSQLLINRGLLNLDLDINSPEIELDNHNGIQEIINDFGTLPPNPFFEIHPYYLAGQLKDFSKIIIGTFPPISYLLDRDDLINNGIHELININHNIIQGPDIPFYHGNNGSMWDYLLDQHDLDILYNLERFEKKQFLIDWLNNHEIVYNDIIHKTQRMEFNAKDSSLFNIIPNEELIRFLFDSESVKYLLFNTSSTFNVGGIRLHINFNLNNNPGRVNVNTNPKSFDLFIRTAQDLGIKIYFRILEGPTHHFDWIETTIGNADFLNNNLRNKIQFELKMDGTVSNFLKDSKNKIKQFQVITGPSPSRVANLGVPRNLNFINWNNGNNGNVQQFIELIYHSFRNQPNPDLYYLNIGNV